MKNFLEVIAKQLETEGKTVVTVLLPGEVVERKLFLTRVSIKSSMFGDFKDTFAGKLSKEEIEKAKSVFPKKKTKNTFIVFLDNEFKPVFAFNSLFGRYNKEKKAVVYETPWRIFLGWEILEYQRKKQESMY